MTLCNRIAMAVLPLALASPIARAADGFATAEQQMAASRKAAAAHKWVTALSKNSDLPVAQKVGMVAEALRKELASPAPTLRIKGSLDIYTEDVNYSNQIQSYYIVALVNTVNLGEHGDPSTLQSSLATEKDADVRDRLILAMGQISPREPDARQAAVYPRIVQLVQTNTEEKAKFPYELAINALHDASRYPSYAGQVVPLLTTIAARGGAGTDREAPKIDSQAAMAAKEALHRWGYSLVRDAKCQLQAVPKAQTAAKQ